MGMPELAPEQEQGQEKQPGLRPRPIVAPGGGWGWGMSWVVWLAAVGVVVGVFRREVGRGVRGVRARLL